MHSKAISVLLLCLAPAVLTGRDEERRVRKTFAEVDTLFANPGAGWMTEIDDVDEPRFPSTVAYARWNWNELEPQEGQFHWELVDTAIAKCRSRGARLAFRVMATNPHSRGYYCSPKWLFDLGCRSYEYIPKLDTVSQHKRFARIEPDYADPLFLEKHSNFIRELGRRYNGHPGIEFVDIGSYGLWGEWHTPHPAPDDVLVRLVDLYGDAFRQTPRVMLTANPKVLEYALARGAGVRRDGVGSPWDAQSWRSKKYAHVRGLADVWRRAPVVFEWFESFRFMTKQGWSVDQAIEFMLENHVTFVYDNLGKVPEAERSEFERLARLAGYRFTVREISHPERVRRGEAFRLEMKWANAGVGRLYRKHALALYLLDSSGRVLHQKLADSDPRAWLPGDHEVSEAITPPSGLDPGTYGVAAALVDESGTPAVAVAVDTPASGRVYYLSSVVVE
ncbi:MAG: DUF4832 domain-containing protein [Bryobacteraceae bacterium]|nr:DUF4832 domain-containing protein [Bryobacteraceae bacterium]